MRSVPTRKEVEKVLGFMWLRGLITQQQKIDLEVRISSYVK